jgi:hypothetical protein
MINSEDLFHCDRPQLLNCPQKALGDVRINETQCEPIVDDISRAIIFRHVTANSFIYVPRMVQWIDSFQYLSMAFSHGCSFIISSMTLYRVNSVIDVWR